MNYMTRYDMNSNQKLERSKQAVPLRRTTSFLTANYHFAYGKLTRTLLITLVFLLTAVSGAWGQTDYSGTYFIASNSGYNSGNTANNYYWVPAANPQLANNEDAYYSANYSLANGDPEKPYVTTYKTNRDNNSIWQIESSGDGYYYIKHWLTGKYLLYKQVYTGGNAHRKAVHLETVATPGDDAKFDIQVSGTGVSMRPVSLTSGNRFLNPGGGNKDSYNGGTSSPYYSGLIGVYNSATDANSVWRLEDAVTPPTFSVSATGDITITADEGTTIHYTTNGDTPTAESATYASAITPTTGMTAITAIAVRTSDSKVSNAVSLPLQTYTFYIINRSGEVAVKYEVKQAVGKSLSTVNDIPAAIRSPYLSGESAAFYSFSEAYTSADQLSDEVKITATPAADANIYVTYTTDHLTEKFLHLRGARAFNIKTDDGYAYDNDGTLAYYSDSDANPLSQPKYLWNIGGNDPYNVQIKNLGSDGRYLVFSTAPTLSLAASPTTKFILMEGSASGDGIVKLMAATGTGANDFSKAEIQANPFSISTTYHLIDRQGKLIVSVPSTASELKLPDEWVSPLVSEYHYYSTASNTDGVYSLSGTVTSPFDVGSGGNIYVNYDVSDAIDLDGRNSLGIEGKKNITYMLRFLDGEEFQQEDGDDGVMSTTRKAIYPYSNGDAALYVYGQERWELQLESGASTRSRWLWYIEPANNPTTKEQLDPYHVKISSYQTQTNYKWTEGEGESQMSYTRNFHSYLRTYQPDGYDKIVTGVTNDNPLTTGYADSAPANSSLATEYMILGQSLSQCRLRTLHTVALDLNGDGDTADEGESNERQTVNSFEMYWKNNPTVNGREAGSKPAISPVLSNPVTDSGRNIHLTDAQKADITAKGWHVYEEWANSQPWVDNGDATKSTGRKYLKEEHVFQTIDMGTEGHFVFEEVSLAPQVILIDNHGWEIMRVPLAKTDVLKTYDSPMVEQYQWYATSSKEPGYHKYIVSGDPGHVSTSLADVPSGNTDFYVTYTVKPHYANAYTGAATAEGTKASAYLLKQGGKYAKTSGSTIDKTDAPASMDDVPKDMQWYLRPNFDIDHEMGYRYAGESGAQDGALSKTETELAYFEDGHNGFDPYNIQIQNREYDKRFFTANTSAIALKNGVWAGTSNQITLQNLNVKRTATGYDQTTLNITNATFMVVSDANGNMRLMPRFDNSVVANSDGSSNPFRTLTEQAAAATTGDEGDGVQTLWIELVPEVKEIHSSAEMTEMNGRYLLAEDFTFEAGFTSLGTSSEPFTGIIDGQLNTISSPGKAIVAFANGAKIYNLILDNVTITNGGDDVGAICNVASGSTHIYNCGVNDGEIGGTTNVGGIVGKLEGTSRVVNCYSYADIKSGTNRAGIVGNNTQTSTQASLTTMVMNCMFYGDIATGGTISPIYGGTEINNVEGGMNNYNYYRYRSSYSVNKQITKYNRALAMEEKFINRFERYRLLLNSNKNLAAKYVDITPDELAKWVLETADRSIANPKPYPVLKKQNIYPSIINYDAENTPDSASVGRLNGGKLGKTLAVTIRTKSQKTTGGQSWPTASGSDVLTTSLTLIRTDKDTVRYNFNYDKVQLPYYNDIGTGNYTEKRVVTGWKITDITGGTAGTYSEADEWGGYNFADRNCTKKDLYSVSGRVFSQGAYWDVPKGVTAITIEPYWAIANYVSDETYDVVYDKDHNKKTFSLFGTQYTNNTTIDIYNDGSTDQKVYTSISGALAGFDNSDKTVYDQAVVLVGNVHQMGNPTSDDKPYTLMSIDMNHDNEPDYSYIFSHDNRKPISPIRYDFLNIMGIAEAQIPKEATTLRNVSIFNLKGWFEITNTCLVNFSQFEYDNNKDSSNGITKSSAPLILLGGTFEQFVSTQKSDCSTGTKYIHIGSNAWFAKFGMGTHSDGQKFTAHVPVSVTGGDYDEFYLSGTYQPNIINMQSDNAECYISGGRFGEMAGASLEAINGDVRWDINWADITNFYGGGVNGVNPITGDIRVDMANSHVNQYCGGPKFGDMVTGKTVTTNATDCVFGTYFGAGYGGNSYNRVKYYDATTFEPADKQGDYANERGKYYDGESTSAPTANYGKKGKGVATDCDYEYFIWSTGQTGARFYIKFVSFSLAITHSVTSTLNKCKVAGNVYGGGSLGKVNGNVNTTLTNCEINGNVFGAGYSATLPTVGVRNTPAFSKNPKKNIDIAMFEPGEFNTTAEYEWKHVDAMPSNGEDGIKTSDGKNYVYTTEDLSHTNLGSVSGAVTLTITGNSVIGTAGDNTTGNVYGGGDQSTVNNTTTPTAASTTVTISGNTEVLGNVFGGGNQGLVSGSATVNIEE